MRVRTPIRRELGEVAVSLSELVYFGGCIQVASVEFADQGEGAKQV